MREKSVRMKGGVLRPGVTSVLFPHQAEGAQVWASVQAVSRYQLLSPAQFSGHSPSIPCKQGGHVPGGAKRAGVLQSRGDLGEVSRLN